MSEQFRVSVSFEHDTKPVLTVREDFSSEDFESAFKTGLFRAFKKLPGRFNARSVVCVVEKLGIADRFIMVVVTVGHQNYSHIGSGCGGPGDVSADSYCLIIRMGGKDQDSLPALRHYYIR